MALLHSMMAARRAKIHASECVTYDRNMAHNAAPVAAATAPLSGGELHHEVSRDPWS